MDSLIYYIFKFFENQELLNKYSNGTISLYNINQYLKDYNLIIYIFILMMIIIYKISTYCKNNKLINMNILCKDTSGSFENIKKIYNLLKKIQNYT